MRRCLPSSWQNNNKKTFTTIHRTSVYFTHLKNKEEKEGAATDYDEED